LTFSNETASGWQTATFTNGPITISPNTTYVVSYHSNGNYTNTTNYFTSAVTSGPLTAPSSSTSGGNGVYRYGSASAFPTSTYNASNYWVDVLFNPSTTTTNQNPVATNDSGFSTTQNTALTIQAATLLANDTDPNGDALSITGVTSDPTNGHGTATFTPSTNTVSFAPTAGYTGPASFSYTISDGRGGTATANVSLTVNAPGTGPVSLFSASATPANLSTQDTAVELGMKFQATTAGTVSGIRFYKGTGETGTHTGSLWTSTGTRLGTLTFSNETASGWQTATFTNGPITISPNTTYVVSYHSNGRYASTSNFFTADVTSGPLKGLADTASSRNGVYAYGNASLFPTSSFQKTNYWVDVLFNPQSTAA
jgi:hypothetical protein